MEDFLAWIYQAAGERGWSINKLAAHMELSSTAVHATMNGRNSVTWEFCAKLADALRLPREEVFRKAGLLPQAANPQAVQAVIDVARHLSLTNLALYRDLGQFLYERQQEEERDG